MMQRTISVLRGATVRLLAVASVLSLASAVAQSGEPAFDELPRPGSVGADLSQGEAEFDPAVEPELVVQRAKTGHLLVKPLVNDIDAGWFIFDTGAGICVVSTQKVEHLELVDAGPIQAVGVGGAKSARLYRAERIELGPVRLLNHPTMATDLSQLAQFLGVEVSGVIGYGVLSRCIAEIDFELPQIALYAPEEYALASGEWTPISLDGRVPTIPATFEGHPGQFRIDTGANSTLTFHEPSVCKWNLLEGRATTDASLGGVGGFVRAKKGTIESFEMCGVVRKDVPVEFAIERKGAFAEATRDGNIGLGLLQSFRMVIDYPGQRIAMRSRER